VEEAGFPGGISSFFWLSMAGSMLFGLFFALISRTWILFPLGLAAGYFAPRAYLNVLLRQRKGLLHHQLPEAITLISNAMRAGNSLAQALETASDEMGAPLGEEFRNALDRHRMGQSLPQCLEWLDEKIGLPDFSLVATATTVSIRMGSNLPEMFAQMANTMRRRAVMKEKIKSLTSQGKMQGVVVGLLPVALLVLVNLISPGIMGYFLHSLIGGILLSLCLVLELLGVFFIRKIVSIDV
jgi:tight adherence protein B